MALFGVLLQTDCPSRLRRMGALRRPSLTRIAFAEAKEQTDDQDLDVTLLALRSARWPRSNRSLGEDQECGITAGFTNHEPPNRRVWAGARLLVRVNDWPKRRRRRRARWATISIPLGGGRATPRGGSSEQCLALLPLPKGSECDTRLGRKGVARLTSSTPVGAHAAMPVWMWSGERCARSTRVRQNGQRRGALRTVWVVPSPAGEPLVARMISN
jgi:hypothetical protein